MIGAVISLCDRTGNMVKPWAPPSDDRGDVRSVTPMGFARAVFAANAPQAQKAAA